MFLAELLLLPVEPNRKIIHVDMDCFYAAVEMRDNPSLANKAVAVGGSSDRRGVISTCNYRAREFGVHSAMATAQAVKLCPELIVVPGRMSHYKAISVQLRSIFERYTDLIQPVSLDEAFLDVSRCQQHQGSATLIAKAILENIEQELMLTASAGVAPNKFLAKIASEQNKPNGLFVIRPEQIAGFVEQLELRKIPGVGPATLRRLARQQLFTCHDVQQWSLEQLLAKFGKFGQMLHQRSQGVDERAVNSDWVRKSLSVERTFAQDIQSIDETLTLLPRLHEELLRRLHSSAKDRLIKSQQIKLKFHDFISTTVEQSSANTSLEVFSALLHKAWHRGGDKAIRLLGVGVAFHDPDLGKLRQLDLFSEHISEDIPP